MILLKLPIKLHNWNEIINANRRNKYLGASLKKKEMEVIEKYIPNGKITKYPIKITCIWHIKNSQADLDNKCIKSILDQMQKSGILENDNIKHINEITYKAVKDKEEYVEIYYENN